MFGDLFNDPFGHWGNIPEIPEPKEPPTDNDIVAMHLMGCLYAILGMAILIIFIGVIYMLVQFCS